MRACVRALVFPARSAQYGPPASLPIPEDRLDLCAAAAAAAPAAAATAARRLRRGGGGGAAAQTLDWARRHYDWDRDPYGIEVYLAQTRATHLLSARTP